MSILETLANTDLLNGIDPQEQGSSAKTAEETQREEAEKAELAAKQEAEAKAAEEAEKQAAEAAAKQEAEKQAAEQTKEKEEEHAQPIKHKVDYLNFIEEYGDVINAYRTEKSIDYSKLSPEELMHKSYRLKYAGLSEDDIREELKAEYGIGVDAEDFDDEDLISHRAKQRKLKIDAINAVKDLEAYRENLTLPDFELELPAPEVPKTETVTETPEEVVRKAAEAEAKQNAEWREKTWAPKIKEVASGISSLTQKISVEGLGELDVKIDLDEADQKVVSDYLKDWVYHPSDSKFLNEQGEPDLVGFVSARASDVLLPKFLAAVGQATINKYKEIHLKQDVINFNQNPRNATIPKYEGTELEDLAAKLRK